MAKINLKPVSQTFDLSIDPSGKSKCSVRQANTGDNVHLANMFSETTQIFDDELQGTVQLKKKWNFAEVMRERAFLVLGACDIVDIDTDKPLFEFAEGRHGPMVAMTREDFYNAWGLLPPFLAEEIYSYVLKVNPHWDPKHMGE